ncbi:MAG: hypothetical protein ABJE10_13950 [bacterium]
MSLAYRVLGWGYVAACSAIVVLLGNSSQPATTRIASPIRTQIEPTRQPLPQPTTHGNSAAEWFQRVKPSCNSVEVTVLQRSDPAPRGADGVGYHAACLALAGKIDDAKQIIDSLDESGRRTAASIVFDIGHPVADAGDDRSAGPIMELVVGYLPDHYMALYHAGMAEYMLAERDLAKKNIEAFLKLYTQNDGWRSNGLQVLGRLNDSTSFDVERRRPAEP